MTNMSKESFFKDENFLISAKWSCPCCAFISPSSSMLLLEKPLSINNSGVFIDNKSDEKTNIKNNDILLNPEKKDEQLSLAQTLNELIEKHKLHQFTNDSKKSPFIVVDTHGHSHLQKEPSITDYDMPLSYFKNSNIIKIESREHKQEKAEKIDVRSNQIDLSKYNDTSLTGKALIDIQCISLTCAVSCHDWQEVLRYASTSPYILPALGVHPWYIEDVLHPRYKNKMNHITENEKNVSVLNEKKNDQNVISNINDQLPSSVAYETSTINDPIISSIPSYIQDLQALLHQHPLAFVGEIGLCKSAKNIRFHPDGKKAGLHEQMQIFLQQFKLAAAMKRGVTIHCVGYHKELLNAIKQIMEDAYKSAPSKSSEEIIDDKSKIKSIALKPVENIARNAFPPVMSFHSFSGSASFVKEICKIEEALYFSPNASHVSEATTTCKPKAPNFHCHQMKNNNLMTHDELSMRSTSILKSTLEKHLNSPTDATASLRLKSKPMFYFGYSHLINVSMASQSPKSIRKHKEALRSIPMERILVESDVSNSNNVVLGTIGAIKYIAKSLDKSIEEISYLVSNNGIRFLSKHIAANTNVV